MEHKFRVWKDYSAQFEYFTLEEALSSKENDLDRIKQSSPQGWEQYTGLKEISIDIDDEKREPMEIVQNDIVRILYSDWISKLQSDPRTIVQYMREIAHVGKVVFVAGAFKIQFHSGATEDFNCGRHGFREIIGNSHENPELLK